MILGIPFLQTQNPDIGWKSRTFKWRTENSARQLMQSQSNPSTLSSITLNHLAALDVEGDMVENWENDPEEYHNIPIISEPSISDDIDRVIDLNYKATVSTNLAKEKRISEPTFFNLPSKFGEFANLFDKKKSERFPPSTRFDHKIETKPEFEPK